MSESPGSSVSANIANQFREFYFGVNWTFVNLKDTLDSVDHRMALAKVRDFNTIATLAFHIMYYSKGVAQVLEGGPLEIKDKFSFDHPPIHHEKDWVMFKEQLWAHGEAFCKLVENVEESKLHEDIDKPIYGSLYRNLCGIIEHGHYHLGQIVMLKRIISARAIGK